MIICTNDVLVIYASLGLNELNVLFGSGQDLLPDVTKLLPELMLTCYE